MFISNQVTRKGFFAGKPLFVKAFILYHPSSTFVFTIFIIVENDRKKIKLKDRQIFTYYYAKLHLSADYCSFSRRIAKETSRVGKFHSLTV